MRGSHPPSPKIPHFTEWGLTAAELRVALATARGLPDKAIATELGIQVSTVMAHQRVIKSKMYVHTRMDVARKLWQKGFKGEANEPQEA